jgi:molybdopterin synthase catalytic subunit
LRVPDSTSTSSICVHVRLFASYREAAGTNRLDLSVAPGASVNTVLQLLEPRLPALTHARGLVAVNHSYVQLDTILQDGDEVALIPPVSGGR